MMHWQSKPFFDLFVPIIYTSSVCLVGPTFAAGQIISNSGMYAFKAVLVIVLQKGPYDSVLYYVLKFEDWLCVAKRKTDIVTDHLTNKVVDLTTKE